MTGPGVGWGHRGTEQQQHSQQGLQHQRDQGGRALHAHPGDLQSLGILGDQLHPGGERIFAGLSIKILGMGFFLHLGFALLREAAEQSPCGQSVGLCLEEKKGSHLSTHSTREAWRSGGASGTLRRKQEH